MDTTYYYSDKISRYQMKYTLAFFVLFLAIVTPILSVDYRIDLSEENLISLISFLAIGLFSFAGLFFAAYKRPFSLDCVHWTFVLLFFFYVPIYQFLLDEPIKMTDIGAFRTYHMQANILILIWLSVYTITYHVLYRVQTSRHALLSQPDMAQRTGDQNYLLLVFLSIAATATTIATFGLEGMLLRGAVGMAASEQDTKVLWLIVNIFCRALPVAALSLLVLTFSSRRKGYYSSILVIGICALLINFPTSTARFWFGALAFGFTGITLRKRFRISSLWIPILFYFSCLVIMPVLDISRKKTQFADLKITQYRTRSYISLLLGGDFDGTQMFTNTIKYINEGPGIAYGRQLFGVIFFFVPRTIWEDKPVGSGKLIAKYYHIPNKNLSNTLPAEGYLNFGSVGVVIFAAAFAFVLCRLDISYWQRSAQTGEKVSLLSLTYPFLVGFVIFIMRGDLLSSFSYTMGFVTASWIVLKAAQFTIARDNY
ncbi:MAG TPA: hypothetical protein VFB21_20040 [Chthonomonadaceae bacterium]|nr:hypothetical protein [Chthonomonadaceae bacterium]